MPPSFDEILKKLMALDEELTKYRSELTKLREKPAPFDESDITAIGQATTRLSELRNELSQLFNQNEKVIRSDKNLIDYFRILNSESKNLSTGFERLSSEQVSPKFARLFADQVNNATASIRGLGQTAREIFKKPFLVTWSADTDRLSSKIEKLAEKIKQRLELAKLTPGLAAYVRPLEKQAAGLEGLAAQVAAYRELAQYLNEVGNKGKVYTKSLLDSAFAGKLNAEVVKAIDKELAELDKRIEQAKSVKGMSGFVKPLTDIRTTLERSKASAESLLDTMSKLATVLKPFLTTRASTEVFQLAGTKAYRKDLKDLSVSLAEERRSVVDLEKKWNDLYVTYTAVRNVKAQDAIELITSSLEKQGMKAKEVQAALAKMGSTPGQIKSAFLLDMEREMVSTMSRIEEKYNKFIESLARGRILSRELALANANVIVQSLQAAPVEKFAPGVAPGARQAHLQYIEQLQNIRQELISLYDREATAKNMEATRSKILKDLNAAIAMGVPITGEYVTEMVRLSLQTKDTNFRLDALSKQIAQLSAISTKKALFGDTFLESIDLMRQFESETKLISEIFARLGVGLDPASAKIASTFTELESIATRAADSVANLRAVYTNLAVVMAEKSSAIGITRDSLEKLTASVNKLNDVQKSALSKSIQSLTFDVGDPTAKFEKAQTVIANLISSALKPLQEEFKKVYETTSSELRIAQSLEKVRQVVPSLLTKLNELNAVIAAGVVDQNTLNQKLKVYYDLLAAGHPLTALQIADMQRTYNAVRTLGTTTSNIAKLLRDLAVASANARIDSDQFKTASERASIYSNTLKEMKTVYTSFAAAADGVSIAQDKLKNQLDVVTERITKLRQALALLRELKLGDVLDVSQMEKFNQRLRALKMPVLFDITKTSPQQVEGMANEIEKALKSAIEQEREQQASVKSALSTLSGAGKETASVLEQTLGSSLAYLTQKEREFAETLIKDKQKFDEYRSILDDIVKIMAQANEAFTTGSKEGQTALIQTIAAVEEKMRNAGISGITLGKSLAEIQSGGSAALSKVLELMGQLYTRTKEGEREFESLRNVLRMIEDEGARLANLERRIAEINEANAKGAISLSMLNEKYKLYMQLLERKGALTEREESDLRATSELISLYGTNVAKAQDYLTRYSRAAAGLGDEITWLKEKIEVMDEIMNEHRTILQSIGSSTSQLTESEAELINKFENSAKTLNILLSSMRTLKAFRAELAKRPTGAPLEGFEVGRAKEVLSVIAQTTGMAPVKQEEISTIEAMNAKLDEAEKKINDKVELTKQEYQENEKLIKSFKEELEIMSKVDAAVREALGAGTKFKQQQDQIRTAVSATGLTVGLLQERYKLLEAAFTSGRGTPELLKQLKETKSAIDAIVVAFDAWTAAQARQPGLPLEAAQKPFDAMRAQIDATRQKLQELYGDFVKFSETMGNKPLRFVTETVGKGAFDTEKLVEQKNLLSSIQSIIGTLTGQIDTGVAKDSRSFEILNQRVITLNENLKSMGIKEIKLPIGPDDLEGLRAGLEDAKRSAAELSAANASTTKSLLDQIETETVLEGIQQQRLQLQKEISDTIRKTAIMSENLINPIEAYNERVVAVKKAIELMGSAFPVEIARQFEEAEQKTHRSRIAQIKEEIELSGPRLQLLQELSSEEYNLLKSTVRLGLVEKVAAGTEKERAEATRKITQLYKQLTTVQNASISAQERFTRAIRSFFEDVKNLVAVQARWYFTQKLIFGSVQVLSDAFSFMKNVERQTARVASAMALLENREEKVTQVQKKLIDEMKRTGESAENLGTILWELISAGLSYKEAMAGVGTITDLAVASELDLSEATRITAGLYRVFYDQLNAVGGATEKWRYVVDRLSATLNMSQIDMQGLVGGLSYLINEADAAGLKFEEVLAVLSVLNNRMLMGTKAGRSASRVLTELASNADKVASAFGIAVDTTKPIEMIDLLAKLRDRLEETSVKGKLSVKTFKEMQDIFGQVGKRAAVGLIQNVDEVIKTVISLESQQFAGLAAKMVEEPLNTATRLAQRFQTTMMALLRDVMYPFFQMAKYITSGMISVADSLQRTSSVAKDLALSVGSVIGMLYSVYKVSKLLKIGKTELGLAIFYKEFGKTIKNVVLGLWSVITFSKSGATSLLNLFKGPNLYLILFVAAISLVVYALRRYNKVAEEQRKALERAKQAYEESAEAAKSAKEQVDAIADSVRTEVDAYKESLPYSERWALARARLKAMAPGVLNALEKEGGSIEAVDKAMASLIDQHNKLRAVEELGRKAREDELALRGIELQKAERQITSAWEQAEGVKNLVNVAGELAKMKLSLEFKDNKELDNLIGRINALANSFSRVSELAVEAEKSANKIDFSPMMKSAFESVVNKNWLQRITFGISSAFRAERFQKLGGGKKSEKAIEEFITSLVPKPLLDSIGVSLDSLKDEFEKTRGAEGPFKDKLYEIASKAVPTFITRINDATLNIDDLNTSLHRIKGTIGAMGPYVMIASFESLTASLKKSGLSSRDTEEYLSALRDVLAKSDGNVEEFREALAKLRDIYEQHKYQIGPVMRQYENFNAALKALNATVGESIDILNQLAHVAVSISPKPLVSPELFNQIETVDKLIRSMVSPSSELSRNWNAMLTSEKAEVASTIFKKLQDLNKTTGSMQVSSYEKIRIISDAVNEALEKSKSKALAVVEEEARLLGGALQSLRSMLSEFIATTDNFKDLQLIDISQMIQDFRQLDNIVAKLAREEAFDNLVKSAGIATEETDKLRTDLSDLPTQLDKYAIAIQQVNSVQRQMTSLTGLSKEQFDALRKSIKETGSEAEALEKLKKAGVEIAPELFRQMREEVRETWKDNFELYYENTVKQLREQLEHAKQDQEEANQKVIEGIDSLAKISAAAGGELGTEAVKIIYKIQNTQVQNTLENLNLYKSAFEKDMERLRTELDLAVRSYKPEELVGVVGNMFDKLEERTKYARGKIEELKRLLTSMIPAFSRLAQSPDIALASAGKSGLAYIQRLIEQLDAYLKSEELTNLMKVIEDAEKGFTEQLKSIQVEGQKAWLNLLGGGNATQKDVQDMLSQQQASIKSEINRFMEGLGRAVDQMQLDPRIKEKVMKVVRNEIGQTVIKIDWPFVVRPKLETIDMSTITEAMHEAIKANKLKIFNVFEELGFTNKENIKNNIKQIEEEINTYKEAYKAGLLELENARKEWESALKAGEPVEETKKRYEKFISAQTQVDVLRKFILEASDALKQYNEVTRDADPLTKALAGAVYELGQKYKEVTDAAENAKVIISQVYESLSNAFSQMFTVGFFGDPEAIQQAEDQYRQKKEEIDRLLAERKAIEFGGIAPEEIERYNELNRSLKEGNKELKQLKDQLNDVSSITSRLGKIFKEVGKAIMNVLIEMVAKMMAVWLLEQLIFNVFGISKTGEIGKLYQAVTGVTFKAKGGIIAGPFIPIGKADVAKFKQAIGIKAMQAGGIAYGPTLGIIGEGKNAEAVVPLPDNRSIPVRMLGGRDQKQEVKIINVMDPKTIPSLIMQHPDAIVNIVSEDIAKRGPIYQLMRSIKK
jgi:TP901 family phage tail tape measure protein